MSYHSLWADSPVGHIQDLVPEILEMASSLSKRGQDAFRALYAQCAGDVATLAYTLMDPHFSWDNSHDRLGGKTLAELAVFSSGILALLEGHKDTPGMEEWDTYQKKARIGKYGITGKVGEYLLQLEQSLGYFPVTAFVQAWLSSREERERYIYSQAFDFWQEGRDKTLTEMAGHLGITGERARQIRVRLFKELTVFLQGLMIGGDCPYDCLDINLADKVNKAEGTAFNANFIRFIIGNAYKTLMVVGNTEESLVVKFKGGTDDAFVATIPKAMADFFDYNAYLSVIETLNARKRLDPQREPLPEGSTEVKDLCSVLAFLRYGWERENDFLILPPNADKNRSDIMEDIIRDAGRPLSIEEIMQEYARRYPDRKTDRLKIRGNIQVNPRIVPHGRTGVYSLAEWTDGSARGGTIRSFVRECLDGSESHIVPSKEVYEYVRRFRPASSDENILCNLMLESEKSFRILWKDGISYLSYSAEDIPEGYQQHVRSQSERRSFSESIGLIDNFISRHGYMPKVCDNPEETRLARFLSNIRSQRRKGQLTEEELSELIRLESKLDGGIIQLELF